MKKALHILIIFALTLLFIRCEKDSIKVAAIKFENPSLASLPADQLSETILSVSIDNNAEGAQRKVKFETTLGTFSNGTATIEVYADDQGIAKAALKSGNSGTASVIASVSAYHAKQEIIFTEAVASGIVSFENTTNLSADADDQSLIAVKVKIGASVPAGSKKVRLETDLGKFQNDSTSILLNADANSMATAYLKSNKSGNGVVKAIVLGFIQTVNVEFKPTVADNVIKFDVTGDPISLADGVTVISVRAIINKNTLPADRTVIFNTELGTFGTGSSVSVIADSEGIATAYLKSSQAGKSQVTIQNKAVLRSREYTFNPAPPERVTLNSDFSIQAGIEHKLTITAKLSRSIGKPTSGYAMVFTAVDADGKTIGVFKNLTESDVNGAVQVDFSAGKTEYRGVITITGTIVGLPGVSSTTQLTVIDPAD